MSTALGDRYLVATQTLTFTLAPPPALSLLTQVNEGWYYYIDNANTSVIYSMTASQSGQAWQTFSVDTQALVLSITNSTGDYNITLDASHCYDENFALGVCGTNDNCFVQMPFTGSGITMYVFSAGFSGMTASFSVDGGPAVSSTIQAPPPPTYQVPNVSLYNVQGLLSGNHTMKMTILDWNGSATSMKFDYAYVNETFVAPPTTTTTTSSMTSTSITGGTSQATSQTPAGNSPTSNKVNLGSVIGGTLGGVAIIASVVIGVFYCRKRRAPRREEDNPFTSEHLNSPTPPPAPYAFQRPFFAQHAEGSPSVSPIQRSNILRDALATSSYLPEPNHSSISSEWSSPVLQPLRRQASHNGDADLPDNPSVSHVGDAGSPSSDTQITSRCSLTTEQLEVISQLRADKVPAETIARVMEGFASSQVLTRGRSFVSTLPPPSYRTQR